jgi:hypothetical protein
LAFNAALLALPFVGHHLYVTMTTQKLIDYAPTIGSLRATRAALEDEASHFSSGWDTPRQAVEGLIGKELQDTDSSAARGFLLAAPYILRGSDTAKLRGRFPANATESQRMIAAADMLLEGPVHTRAMDAINAGSANSGAYASMSDPREIANDALRWLEGAPVDFTVLRLTGLALTAGDDADVRLGASVLRIAKSNAKLSAIYLNGLEARLEVAAPAEKVRSALSDALTQDAAAIVDEGAAVGFAFTRARDEASWTALREELRLIASIARRVSPAGAAGLLAHADAPQDLEKLALLAEAGGDMTAAIAKRNPDRLVLRSAKGAINWTPNLVGGVVALAVVVIALLTSIVATVAGAMGAQRALDRTRAPGAPTLSQSIKHMPSSKGAPRKKAAARQRQDVSRK